MKPGLPIVVTTLFLAACSRAADPAPQEERIRAEAERSAALEAAEKEILDAGLPLPAEPVAVENSTDGTKAATSTPTTNSGL